MSSQKLKPCDRPALSGPERAPDSTRWDKIAFRYLHPVNSFVCSTVGSLIAGTKIHPHPPRYLGSYKSGTGRKSQKEPLPSTKKPTKSPNLSTQNQLQWTELPLVLESAAKSNSSAIDSGSPLTTYVVTVYGPEELATE
jgi:hypothetical protein